MGLSGQRVAQNAGLSSADGVETGLTEKFKAAGKPIGGFETAREQLMLFETLDRSEAHTSELQSLMRISYAVFCLKKKIHSCRKTTLQHSRNISRYQLPTTYLHKIQILI